MHPMTGQPMLVPGQARAPQYVAMFPPAMAWPPGAATAPPPTVLMPQMYAHHPPPGLHGAPMTLSPVPPHPMAVGPGHPVANAPLAASQLDFPTLIAAAAAPRRPAPAAAPTVILEDMPQAVLELRAFAATQPQTVWRTQGSHHCELFKMLNERCARKCALPCCQGLSVVPFFRPSVPALPPLRVGGGEEGGRVFGGQFLLER